LARSQLQNQIPDAIGGLANPLWNVGAALLPVGTASVLTCGRCDARGSFSCLSL